MTQTIHMNMAINVYEYGRGGKCICMFGYTNGNRKPECWGYFSQLVKIEKIQFLGTKSNRDFDWI